MARKESVLRSIFTFSCPRCHDGRMFPEGTLFKVRKFAIMHKSCPCCGQSFEPEPGYYFGAMFVSYAINTALFVTVWVALTFLVEEVTVVMMVASLLFISIFFLPVIFRLSRALWIHIFIRYEGPCDQIPKKEGFR
jgi:uncharacterized protein (DUF983 family)